MSGCANYPIDVDGGLTATPGCDQSCPIDVDVDIPTPHYRVSMSVNIIRSCNSVMGCWEFSNFVLNYINRVWAPVGISFWLKNCRLVQAQPVNTFPLYPGSYNIETTFDQRFLTDPQSINVFVVEDIGVELPGTLGFTQGYGLGGGLASQYINPLNPYNGMSYILIGERHTEHNQTTHINLGRFGNILAHEIGHVLNLEHNQIRGTLMWGHQLNHRVDNAPDQEVRLTPVEIRIARDFVENWRFRPWNFGPGRPPSSITI